MHDLLTQLLVAVNVIVVVGGAIYFVAAMGAKIDRLSEAVNHLANSTERGHDDHEQRLRAVEVKLHD